MKAARVESCKNVPEIVAETTLLSLNFTTTDMKYVTLLTGTNDEK